MSTEFPFLTTRRIFSVSELTNQISGLLEAHFGGIFLEGEITGARKAASGHLYLSLKDETAMIKAVFFKRQLRLIEFKPENGMTVVCRGRVALYEPRGDLQIIVDWMEPSGRGAQRIALEKLKRQLMAEGLFDSHRKKPLPALPSVIGVVTSPTGAAIRDILKVIRERNGKVKIILYPARVQGIHAPEEISAGIAFFNRHHLADVLIVGRGGGSMEDLDAFNTEVVARTVAASEIPIISAVGHEIDTTLSDLAADYRAPTPSAAAEVVILEYAQWTETLQSLKKRLATSFQLMTQKEKIHLQRLGARLVDPGHRLDVIRMKLDEALTRLSSFTLQVLERLHSRVNENTRRFRRLHPGQRISPARGEIDSLHTRLSEGALHLIQSRHDTVDGFSLLLKSLNPKNVLERGYSIAMKEKSGEIIKDSKEVLDGEPLKILLSRGQLACKVTNHEG